MVRFFTTRQPDQLAIVAGLLQEASIQFLVQDDAVAVSATGVMPWTAIWLMNDEDVARARELVKQARPAPRFCPACGYDLTGLPEPRCPECGEPFERPDIAPAWDCPSCGEHHEGQFTECWRCGKVRPDTTDESGCNPGEAAR